MAEICAIVQKAFFIPSDFSVFDKLIRQLNSSETTAYDGLSSFFKLHFLLL